MRVHVFSRLELPGNAVHLVAEAHDELTQRKLERVDAVEQPLGSRHRLTPGVLGVSLGLASDRLGLLFGALDDGVDLLSHDVAGPSGGFAQFGDVFVTTQRSPHSVLYPTSFARRSVAARHRIRCGRSMNVLVVLHEGALGGASRALLRPLPLLEERGFSFSFWAPPSSPVSDYLVGQGHTVSGDARPLRYSLAALREPPGMTARLAALPGYLRRFRGQVVETRPELVYANTLLTLPEATAARATGVATVVHVHETLGTGARDAVAARLLRLASDRVATVSEACALPLRRHGLDPLLVTAGVEAPPRRLHARDGGPPVVGMLGTVCARKGSDVFVAAAEEVARRGGQVEFRLVGPLAPGAERPWAEALVERALRAGVRWSTTTDAFSELRDWDVFALPTREDPFPLAVLEALAVGLPVVATNVGGLPEQVSADTGILVPADEVAALADAIEMLLADPARRREMGERAAEEAAKRFTLERQAEQLERVCRAAVEAAAGRRQARRFSGCHRYPGPVPRTLQRSLRYGLLKTPLPFKRQIELGLLRSYEWYTSSGREDGSVDEHGRPLPPRKLRTLVAGRSDAEYFLDTGRRQAAFFQRLLERNGAPIESMSAVLDFGCGCGRIARWWWDLEDVRVFGCDVNPELIAWARASCRS